MENLEKRTTKGTVTKRDASGDWLEIICKPSMVLYTLVGLAVATAGIHKVYQEGKRIIGELQGNKYAWDDDAGIFGRYRQI